MTDTTKKPELAVAFVRAQAEVMGAKKTADNPFFKSKYADLGACWGACKDALQANGIGVIQGVHGGRLRTTLIHSSGETMCDDGVPLGGYEEAKNPMQALGSAMTYARRYGLSAMLGIIQEDDDGNAVTAEKKMWHGPLKTTELKKQAGDFGKTLALVQTVDALNELLNDPQSKAMLDQLKVDLPQWWDWPEEERGLGRAIDNKRAELEAKE